jgi:hypothetical protein
MNWNFPDVGHTDLAVIVSSAKFVSSYSEKCLVKPTISSLQIGHKSFALAAATADGPPFCKDTTELRS